MNSKKTLNTILAGAVAVSSIGAAALISNATPAEAAKGKEKCYGVVKAGKNGCGSADGKHGCAAQATVDASGQEWIALPKGACEKLVGGSVTPYVNAEKTMEKAGDVMDKAKEMMDK